MTTIAGMEVASKAAEKASRPAIGKKVTVIKTTTGKDGKTKTVIEEHSASVTLLELAAGGAVALAAYFVIDAKERAERGQPSLVPEEVRPFLGVLGYLLP